MASNPQQQQSSMSSPSHFVWFQLVDSITGQPYKKITADKVVVSSSADVADFRDAVKAKQSNKLSAFDAADLRVYKNKAAFVDGKGEPMDPTESLGLLGSKEIGLLGSKEDMLVVAVPPPAGSSLRGDEMEIDTSPLTSVINTKIDGIDLGTEHLKRKKLVEKLDWLVSEKSIVLVSSPAGSGKTSLFKLYQAAAKNIDLVFIPLMGEGSPIALLARAGIDLIARKVSENLVKKRVYFFLDDAQKKYSDTLFWESFLKGTAGWMPKNIKFIISATHSLFGVDESPVEFIALPKLSRMDFLLTDEEAYELLEFRDTGLPKNIRQHKILKDLLVKECGGLVAALRLSIDSLQGEYFPYKDDDVAETLCLQHCLSDHFVRIMARCFGSVHSYPAGNDFKRFLNDCFENKEICCESFKDPQDIASFTRLKKAGILVELPDFFFGFSSPLAKRYYFKWIFPNRSLTAPSSIRDLIRNVVSNMSSTVLKNSTWGGDFPKEAVFQHLFMEGLALHTPPNCSICPELSKIFPPFPPFPPNTNLDTQKSISGEIDFYLNGSLRWGIELLVNGDGIGEHIDRFSPPYGKYVPLGVNDYAIVDFRRNATGQPTGISKHPKRISVFFKNDDYSVAQCLFGGDPAAIEIRLAN